MLSAFLIAAPILTALLIAASLRLESIVAAALCAYLTAVAEVTALTAALSPLREVDRTGLAAGTAVVLLAAGAAWQLRGRPGLPVGHVPAGARAAARDPVLVAFAAVAAAALAYELLLVATVPANNWDSLTYHLARVQFWVQHRGIYWVPNAPTGRINSDQPVAEQQILYLFVALGRGVLFALPQYVAQLAIMASTYLTARRLGHDMRAAACAALVFGTFALVALEATTAQNDLVAASLTALAAAFLLGTSRAELALAGLAVALGVGVKVTTVLVLPVLVLLALRRGRRPAALFGASTLAAFAAFVLWSFVVNLARTGHPAGADVSRLAHTSVTFRGALAMSTAILYRLADLPSFHDRWAWELLAVGVNAAILVAVVATIRRRRAFGRAGLTGLALSAPALTLGFAAAVHHLSRLVHIPVDSGAAFLEKTYVTTRSGPFSWGVNRLSQEDVAGFGPVGGVLLVGLSAGAILAAARRRASSAQLALGLALPVFVLLLGALSASYNAFLARFVLVPAALTVPLAAVLFRRAVPALALLAVSALSVGLVLYHDVQKPFDSPYGHPWRLSQGDAARLTFESAAGDATFDLDSDVPTYLRVGAVLGSDEPSYLLFGASHSRPVEFLPQKPAAAVSQARAHRDWFVVIGGVPGAVNAFTAAGFAVKDLVDPYWRLASDCSVPYVRNLENVFHCPAGPAG